MEFINNFTDFPNYGEMKNVSKIGMHGVFHKDHWKSPFITTKCYEEARPGYNSMKAHEYHDHNCGC